MKNWKSWFHAAAVRAVKTVAQTAAATIGTSAVLGDVDWIMAVSYTHLDVYKRQTWERPPACSPPGRFRS